MRTTQQSVLMQEYSIRKIDFMQNSCVTPFLNVLFVNLVINVVLNSFKVVFSSSFEIKHAL